MAKYCMLPVDSIELDLQNPRIAKWIEMYEGTPTPEQIELALRSGGSQDDVGGPSYHSLKQSIQTNRSIIHPIIVNCQADGKLTVIEGNTRTHIYRELKKSDSSGVWDTIPAMVYEQMSAETIDSIRLQAHLVGTRNWDPYSKAKYLNLLRTKENLTFSQLVDFCGGDKREVQTFIDAYNDMEDYYRPILDSDQDFDPSRFSAFVELQRPRIMQSLVETGYTKEDFSKWVHLQLIFPLATVRKLPQILHNETARASFLMNGAQEAIKLLDTPDSDLSLNEAKLDQLAHEICKRISQLHYAEIQRLRSCQDSPEVTILCDAQEALASLCQDLGYDS